MIVRLELQVVSDDGANVVVATRIDNPRPDSIQTHQLIESLHRLMRLKDAMQHGNETNN